MTNWPQVPPYSGNRARWPAGLESRYGWPTTRRHPRTVAEAYPQEHGSAIEVAHRDRLWWLAPALNVLTATAIGVGLAVAFVQWWSA